MMDSIKTQNKFSMRAILFLKRIDLWLLLSCIIIPLLYMASTGQIFLLIVYTFFYYFYVVMGYQVLSALINRLLLPSEYRSKGRTAYEISLAILLVIGIMCASSVAAIMLFPFTFLLISIGPLVTGWYVMMTLSEISVIKEIMLPTMIRNKE